MAGLIHSGLTEYMGLAFGVLLVMGLQDEKWTTAGLWLMILGLQKFCSGTHCQFIWYASFACECWDTYSTRAFVVMGTSDLPSLLIVVPFGFLCLETLHDSNALFTPIDAPGWNFQRLPAVDLAGFAPFGDWVHPDTRDLNPGIVQNHSIGWGWLICLVFGLYKSFR